LAHNNPLNMCWTLNHQNILEMAQGLISLSRSDNQGKGMVLDLVHWFLCVLIYLSKC
jgi:hypothetical protein